MKVIGWWEIEDYGGDRMVGDRGWWEIQNYEGDRMVGDRGLGR